jgi:hypothetical protein
MIHVDPILRISLMADAAGAITNGFNESDIVIIIRGMCWFHCKKSCDKQLLKVHDKDKRSDLIQGIVTLQLAQTPDIFRSASKLFIDEWSKDADDDIQVFIQYFKSEWIDNNSNWFESYNHPNDAGSTSNNNGNESINGVIKAEDTLRNLLSLNAFMAVAFNILRKWSWARDKSNTNNVIWADTPSISLKQWTDAYQWQQNIKIFKNPDVENKYYFKLVLVLEYSSGTRV